jgi:protoheme IX farnesyltransferase
LDKALAISKPRAGILGKIYDYGVLVKFKLLLFVVFSASFAFLFGTHGSVDWGRFLVLSMGGFMVTGAANALNEIFEKEPDRLMKRTRQRPLPDGRMSVGEALTVSLALGLGGIWLLAHYLNLLCGILGMIALFTYAFAYTPMKRITPFSVFIGAIPGAMPPLIGWVAATGQLGFGGWLLFTLQFFWQFPHFWAIAWRLDDEYRRAGFRMLPAPDGKSRASAFQVVVYTVSLVPVGMMPWLFGFSGLLSAVVITVAGLVFTGFAVRLYQRCTDQAARRVMFMSILYLPVVMIALVLDKI